MSTNPGSALHERHKIRYIRVAEIHYIRPAPPPEPESPAHSPREFFITPLVLILGALIMAASLFIAGITGFGNGLVSLPLLLLLGLPLEQVVVVNLVIIFITRIPTTWKLRAEIDFPKVLALGIGTIAGVVAGLVVFDWLPLRALKLFAAVVIIISAAYLWWRNTRPTDFGRRLAPGFFTWPLTGVLGGFFGITTSLNGLPVAIVSARFRQLPTRFVADISAYFLLSGALILAGLWWQGAVDWSQSLTYSAWWLPGAIAANALGLAVVPRLNRATFERIVLVLIALTGIVTGVLA